MFNIGLLGDFDRDVYGTPFEVALFVSYTFLVVIVMLNVLIAVISDSYDYAQIRAAKLFVRTRVEIAAELVGLGVARSGEPTRFTECIDRLLVPFTSAFTI